MEITLFNISLPSSYSFRILFLLVIFCMTVVVTYGKKLLFGCSDVFDLTEPSRIQISLVQATTHLQYLQPDLQHFCCPTLSLFWAELPIMLNHVQGSVMWTDIHSDLERDHQNSLICDLNRIWT